MNRTNATARLSQLAKVQPAATGRPTTLPVPQGASETGRHILHQPPVSGLSAPIHRRRDPRSEQLRGIVTAATLAQIKAVGPGLALPASSPPYQSWGMCEGFAEDIVQYLQPDHGEPDARSEGSKSAWRRMMQWRFKPGAYTVARVKHAEELLNLYNTRGPFVLRGPRLDDPSQDSTYLDHAIAVAAVVELEVGDRTHIVLCAIDCLDNGKDEETTAARALAHQQGKALTDLTHEEADSAGADRRRIRLIDGHSIMQRMWEHAIERLENQMHADCTVRYMADGRPQLAVKQIARLKDIIATNWAEVELNPDAAFYARRP